MALDLAHRSVTSRYRNGGWIRTVMIRSAKGVVQVFLLCHFAYGCGVIFVSRVPVTNTRKKAYVFSNPGFLVQIHLQLLA